MLFGPVSLTDDKPHSGPKPYGVKWKLTEITPGAIALAATSVSAPSYVGHLVLLLLIKYRTQVQYLISPDEDFSQAGATSGIEYSKSCLQYKQLLIKKRETPTYKRIFAEFDAALFGKARALSNEFVADDGNYDSEVERFNQELEEEEVAEASPEPPSIPLPSTPTPPPQSEHHVSISVTSSVSHTIAASSHMSTTVNATPPPAEREATESSPPVQKTARPNPKKKGGKLAKPSNATPDVNTDGAPIRKERAPRQKKAVHEDIPARVLRART